VLQAARKVIPIGVEVGRPAQGIGGAAEQEINGLLVDAAVR
jgi:hypothetical protein